MKRIIQNNQYNLNQAVVSVELQDLARQQSILSAPFGGIITHEDVTMPKVNITPLTTITIADPALAVFRANISETDSNFLALGTTAKISLASSSANTLLGVVTKIYPEKITLSTGEKVYQVDITSNELAQLGKLGQSGSVLIQSSIPTTALLAPAWTVLTNKYVWIMQNNQPVLKPITTGALVGENIEITSGLKPSDQLIVNPKSVIVNSYPVLCYPVL